MPIRCIVEKTSASSNEVDGYAILPNTTPFNQIVSMALRKMGFTAAQSIGAKGIIEIKNWKPITFDTITDNPDATLEDLLCDLTSVVTLRIKLCSSSKVSAIDEIKEKLLKFLLSHSLVTLQNAGCPIDENLLNCLAKGDQNNISNSTIPTESVMQLFDKWYNNNHYLPKKSSSSFPIKEEEEEDEALSSLSSSPNKSTVHCQDNNKLLTNGNTSPEDAKRARTSFDPDQEIPRLQNWFKDGRHPSKEQMQIYLDELNNLETRNGKKSLDLTNIVYWFKNNRAALKRHSSHLIKNKNQNQNNNKSIKRPTTDENENEQTPPPPSSSSIIKHEKSITPNNLPPVLPNSNAVYVFNPNDDDDNDDDDGGGGGGDDNSNHSNDDDVSISEYSDDYYSINKVVDSNKNNMYGQDLRKTDNNKRHLSNDEEEEDDDDDDDDDDSELRQMMESKTQNNLHYNHQHPTTFPTNYSNHSLHAAMLHNQLAMFHPAAALYNPSMLASTPTAHRFTNNNHHHHHHHHTNQMPNSTSTTAEQQQQQQHQSSVNGCNGGGLSSEERKKRSRVFIDPLSEIPKLEKWFIEDTHPSSYMIEKYTEELNTSEYRHRFPKLEPKNVQLWFKNHRAKVKRARLELPINESQNHHHATTTTPDSVSMDA